MSKQNDETELDLTDVGRQVKIWKALANPVRIELLRFLHDGPCCVTLSCIKLGIPQPNLSKHLQILKEAGIIGCRGNGTQHCYFICRPSLVGPLLELAGRKHGYKPCSKPEQRQ